MTAEFPMVLALIRFLALFGRMGGFLAAIPFFSKSVPVRILLLLNLTLSTVLFPTLPAGWGNGLGNALFCLPHLMLIMFREVLLGIVAALQIRVMLEIFALAGERIGRNMGFTMAKEFDPTLESQLSIIGVLLTQTFIVLFIMRGFHLDCLRIAAASLQQFGPGEFVPDLNIVVYIQQLLSWMFVSAYKLAIPVICVVLFINLAMGLMTKFGQEFQVLMLAFPIRIGLGILILISLIPVIITVSEELSETTIRSLGGLLGQ